MDTPVVLPVPPVDVGSLAEPLPIDWSTVSAQLDSIILNQNCILLNQDSLIQLSVLLLALVAGFFVASAIFKYMR